MSGFEDLEAERMGVMKEPDAEKNINVTMEAGEDAPENEKPKTGSAFEGIYDRMPDISIRALDCFIGICVAALIAVVLIGILRANHVF